MQSDGKAAVFRQVSARPGPLTLLREAIRELSSRRRLIRYLVQADMRKRGSDTLLGNIWWVLDPLLQMAVYVVFITIIARRPAPDYPLFILAAVLPWKWFSSMVNDATSAVARQAGLIRQIAFPKMVLPVASATAGVVGFAWGLLALLAVMLFYRDRISVFLVLIPVIAVVQYAFSLAVAIFVSAANVFFRDLGNVTGHLLRLWWFLSPGLYSLDALDNVSFVQDNPVIKTIANLNPFAVLFEAYRAVIYGSPDGGPPHLPEFTSLGALLVGSIALAAVATVFFKRLEPDFAKVL